MSSPTARTREQSIERAAEAFADLLLTCERMTPREQAEAAWTPTSPYSVDELEDRIRRKRGLEPLHRKTA